jgi:hypothetical protein
MKPTVHIFIKEGKLFAMDSVPEYPKSVLRGECSDKFNNYQSALDSAKSSAIEVENQEEFDFQYSREFMANNNAHYCANLNKFYIPSKDLSE